MQLKFGTPVRELMEPVQVIQFLVPPGQATNDS
jgi:hypothetical protein